LRLFFAFSFSDTEKRRIGECVNSGKELYPDLKWVKPENIHLTLHFLGDLDRAKTDACIKILEHPDLAGSGFNIEYEGFGRFPSKGIPRVLYIKLTGGIDECSRFHQVLGKLLSPVTPIDRKPYIPHITAARVKGRHDVYPDVKRLICPAGTVAVRRLVLFESVLQPRGAVYREVAGRELPVKS
jgi:2'-5' RNA ligase